jgi:hypothetical protein
MPPRRQPVSPSVPVEEPIAPAATVLPPPAAPVALMPPSDRKRSKLLPILASAAAIGLGTVLARQLYSYNSPAAALQDISTEMFGPVVADGLANAGQVISNVITFPLRQDTANALGQLNAQDNVLAQGITDVSNAAAAAVGQLQMDTAAAVLQNAGATGQLYTDAAAKFQQIDQRVDALAQILLAPATTIVPDVRQTVQQAATVEMPMAMEIVPASRKRPGVSRATPYDRPTKRSGVDDLFDF